MAFCSSNPPNCTSWLKTRLDEWECATDPDIEGIGVLFAFIASPVVTMFLAFYYHSLHMLWDSPINSIDMFVAKGLRKLPFVGPEPPKTWKRTTAIIEKVVLSLSDQQLLTGLAMVIAGIWNHCNITTYHLALVDDLAWLSVNVHLASLDVIQGYMHSHTTLRSWRVGLMLVRLVFMMLYEAWEAHYWTYSACIPAQCVLDDLAGNIYGSPAAWFGFDTFLLLSAFTIAVSSMYKGGEAFCDEWLFNRHLRRMDKRKDDLRARLDCNLIGQPMTISMSKRLVLSFRHAFWQCLRAPLGWVQVLVWSRTTGFITSLAWFGYTLYDLVNDRKDPPSRMTGDQNKMGFGQIVPLFLLASTIFVIREARDDTPRTPHSINASLTMDEQRAVSLTETNASDSPPPAPSRRVDTEGRIGMPPSGHQVNRAGTESIRRSTFEVHPL